MKHATARLELATMSEETGHGIRDRRLRMGLSVRQLAEEAGVDRGRLAKLEAGDANVRDTTISKVTGTLARLEQEMGMNDPEAAPGEPDPRVVTFQVEGVFGAAKVSVQGPIEDSAELSRLFSQLLESLKTTPEG